MGHTLFCTSNFIAALCHGVPAGGNSFGYGRISNSRHIPLPTVNRDPALKRIASIGAAVFGMACAGLIGFAVTSAEQTSAYGILFVTSCLFGVFFSRTAVATSPSTARTVVASVPKAALKAGAHATQPTVFSKGVVPRNILKPGFQDTGSFFLESSDIIFLNTGIVAVRLRAAGGGMAARFAC